MRQYFFLGITSALLLSSQIQAIEIGNDVSTGRANASDGAPEVFQVYHNDPVPGSGNITSYSIFDQGGNNQPGYSFHAYVLRPQGGGNYLVLSDDTLLPTGTGVTVSYDVTDIAVQSGDLIAHFGRGVPYTDGPEGGDFVKIYYPSIQPTVSTTITLPSANYPQDAGPYIRDYAFAANFEVPEPASLSLLTLGGLGLLVRRRSM